MGWLNKIAQTVETAIEETIEDVDKIIGRALGEPEQ